MLNLLFRCGEHRSPAVHSVRGSWSVWNLHLRCVCAIVLRKYVRWYANATCTHRTFFHNYRQQPLCSELRCVIPALYSLFICMTQDGWVAILKLFRVSISVETSVRSKLQKMQKKKKPKKKPFSFQVEECSLFLQLEGGAVYAAGVIFLIACIVICAFLFSNLIVAVVVANLVGL